MTDWRGGVTEDTKFKIVCATLVVVILSAAAFWGTIAYVAYHFITKYW